MADRPVIFSGPMVRALLAGTKTQTRRVLRLQPIPFAVDDHGTLCDVGCLHVQGDQLPRITLGRVVTRQKVPYAVGDRLWVRETWATWMHAPNLPLGMGGRLSADPGEVAYKATDPEWDHLMADRASLRELAAKLENGRTGNWVVRSPIHMPRAFSRLTLTVTAVRVQRLQDISEDDARAEGITPAVGGGWTGAEGQAGTTPQAAYAVLWNSLHGPDAWAKNPWVAAISFTTTPANIDSLPEQP